MRSSQGVGPSYLHKKGHSLLFSRFCGGFAGSVLRSQEGLGEEGRSECPNGAPHAPRGPHLFCGGGVLGLALGIGASTGLRGIGPALAGNVGASWAFALSREGDQDVDVPMLAPARSRSAWHIWVGFAGPGLCSLWTDPAAPGVGCLGSGIGLGLNLLGVLRSGPFLRGGA